MKKFYSLNPRLVVFASMILGFFLSLIPGYSAAQTTVPFTGTATWTCPIGVFSVNVQAWGGGGAGGVAATIYGAGGGGGGGAYASSTIAVTPGTVYTVTVGSGGIGNLTGTGGAGGSSWFGSSTTILAVGGSGGGGSLTTGIDGIAGTGGTSAASIGTTKFSAGNGAAGTGSNTAGSIGGGGGSSAGTASNGNNAIVGAGGVAPTGGGAGATGTATNVAGNPATALGGGGAGGKTGSGAGAKAGGAGFRGQVNITYTQLTYKSQLVGINYGTSPWCAGTVRNVTIQIKNNGTATWTDGSPDINIGVKWNTNGANWTDYYIRVDAGNLAPGATGTYLLPITASNNTGSGYTTPFVVGSTNNLIFDIVYEGVSWFGDNGGGVGPGNTKFTSSLITIAGVPTAVSALASPNPICELTTLSLTGSATNATGWSWTGPNSFTSALQSPTISNISLAAAGIYTLTSSNTCGAATAVNTANLVVNPKPIVNTPAAVCVGSNVTLSPTSGGTWVSNNPAIASVTSPAGIATGLAPGSATFTFTQSGCSSTTAILTVNKRPTAVITSANSSICNPGTTNITGTVTASGNWTVSLSNGGGTANGSGNGVFSLPVSPLVTTTYTITSLSDANCTSAGADLTGSTLVTVNEPVSITTQPDPSQTTCSTFPVSFSVAATGTGLSYQWYFNGNPLSDNANITGANTSTLNLDQAAVADAGTYYVVVSGLAPCASSQSGNAVLVINQEIDITTQPAPQSLCAGSTATFTISATGTGVMYQWRKGNTPLVDGGNISGSTTATLTITNVTALDAAANYNVVLTSPGGFCSQAISSNVQLIVKPIPVATSTPAAQTICSGNNTSIALTSSVSGSTYSWNVIQTGVSGGSGASGSVIAQTLSATGAVAGTATYTITPTANSCLGLPVSVDITVNPKPDVSATPASQTICSGNATSIALSGSVAGTSYSWTVVQTGVSGASASSGTDILQPLTATGNTAGTAVYTITPTANGCPGAAITVTITVNPAATITATPSSPTICSGSNTAVALSSNVTGASLSWTVVQANVSGASAGSGTSISQVLSTTGTIAGNAVYTLTATTGGCPGIPTVVTVTVNPIPSVTATPSSQTICSTAATSVALASNVAGAAFSWTVAQTGVSGATASSGTSIGQILATSGTVAGTAVYTITPSAGGCSGPSTTVSITVNPNVTILPLTQAICNSGTILPIAISGAVAGTITGWTRDNPTGITSSLGLSGSGTINGTFSNSATAAITVTFSVTAQASNGCLITKTITVIVDATLVSPVISASQIVCTGSNAAPLSISTPPTGGSTAGYTYQWQSSSTPGGPWTNIAGATAATYTPPTSTKYYQLVVTNACGTVTSNEVQISTATDFGISFDGDAPGPLCSGSSFSYTETSGSILGSLAGSKYIRFSWSSQTPGAFTSSTVNPYGVTHTILFGLFTYYDGTATFTVNNPTNAPISSNLLITPNIYNSNGTIYCNLTPEIIPVTINPVPKLFPYTATVCSGTAFSISPVNGSPSATTIVPANTTYSWGAPVVSGGMTGGAAASAQTSIGQTLVNPTNIPQTATYTITPTYIGSPNCPGSTFTVTVTVNPKPVIPAQTIAICNNSAFTIAPVNAAPTTIIPAGTTYSWPAPVVTGGITGTSAQANQTSVSQTLSNPTTTAQTATYTVTPTSGAAGSCPGTAFTITVTVNPIATATISSSAATVCQGSAATITFTGSANATVTYTVNGGANQTIAINAFGTGTLNTGALSVNTTYTLVSIAYPVTGCARPLTGSVTVNVNPAATAAISATPLALCAGQSSTISFTGTPNAVVTYKINSGANQTITLNGAGTASVSSVITVNTTYTLVSVAYPVAPNCSQVLSTSVNITVNPNANAGVISGTSPLCIGATASYASNGNTSGVWTSTNTSVATVNTAGLVTAMGAGSSNITYTINTGCNSPVSAFKTLTVSPNATAGTVSGTSPLCVNAQVLYSASGGNAGGVWSTSNAAVATVTTAGIVKAISIGSAIITYTVNTGCNAPAVSSQTVQVLNSGAASTPGAINGAANVCATATGLIYTIAAVPNASAYVWTVPTGWSVTSGAGTVSITVTSGAAGGNITVTAGNTCGFSGPSSFAVGIAAPGQWKGITANWHDPVNWCGGIPTSTMNVVIPAGTPNDPVISLGVGSVKNLTVQTGAILTINGNTLQVAGVATGNAAINATNGTVEMIGASAQTLSGSLFTANKVRNLIISNTSGVSFTGTNDTLKLTGLLNFSVSNATITTNNNLTLMSSAGGTASFGDMTNNGALSGNKIVGNVTVERYIPGHAKAWQFMAVPTFGQTINQAWQEGNAPLANAKPGYGTIITSNNAGAVGLGFDVYTATGPTMKTYDPATDLWVGVSAPTIPIANSKGYMFFVRGDRSVTAYNQAATTTILRTNGKLYTTGADAPPVSTVLPGKLASIGNPYASTIDFTKITKSANVDNKFYVWDPLLTNNYNGLGGYQTISSVTGWKPTPGGTANYDAATAYTAIQSGQAFFVYSTSGGGTVSFTEPAKITGSSMQFRTADNSLANRQFLRLGLYNVSNGANVLADGNVLAFDEQFSNSVNSDDAIKIANTGENFGISSSGKTLSVEARTPVVAEDTVFYTFNNLHKPSYELRFEPENLDVAGMTAFFVDKFTNTSTPLNLSGSTAISFSITNDAGSYAANRFYVVFKMSVVLPVTFTKVSAALQAKNIMVDWQVENEAGVRQYEVEHSADGRNYNRLTTTDATVNGGGSAAYNYLDEKPVPGLNYYRVRSVDMDGKTSYSSVAKVMLQADKPEISIYPNPITNGVIYLHLTNQPAGAYGVKLINKLGEVLISKTLNHAEGTGTEPINWDYNFAHGMYHLEITQPDHNRKIIKVMY